jgi:uncharacterized protein YggE
LAVATACRGQVSGNIGYAEAGGKARAEQSERNKRLLTEHELPPTGDSMFVEANVLMNVQADAYVALFGVVLEGAAVAECHQKMDATLKQFFGAVRALGIAADDLHVDFIAQNKIYGFEVVEDVAREKLTGFELKKNVSIRYRDPLLLDRLVAVAGQSQIFDLIKVDYVVADVERVHERLAEEAAQIVKHKTARYARLLGAAVQGPPQVYAERTAVYYPAEMYDSYTAYESEDLATSHVRQKYVVQSARKSRTFFFHGLDADGYDRVINPLVTQPVVQFTTYLKVKYQIDQPGSPEPAK